MASTLVVGIRASRSGAGATFVASRVANVAAAQGQRVLVVDAAYPSGDLAAVLAVPLATVYDELTHGDADTPSTFAAAIRRNARGVGVLKLAMRQDAESPTADAIRSLLDAAAQSFDLVIIDLCDGIGPMVPLLLDHCKRICVVSDSSDRGLNRTAALMRDLNAYGLSKDSICYCINREQVWPVSGSQHEAPLDIPPVTVIPDLIQRADGSSGRPSGNTAITETADRAVQTLWLEMERARRGHVTTMDAESDALATVTRRVREQLVSKLVLPKDLMSAARDAAKHEELQRYVETFVRRLIDEERANPLTTPELRRRVIKDVMDNALGLGPLEALLADDSIDEIMVNGPVQIYVERRGKLERVDVAFPDAATLMAVIERILGPLGRRVDESSPKVDARLKDLSRVNIIIGPLARNGPCMTIRKFPKRRLTLADVVRLGSMDDAMSAFLRLIVEAKQNVVVSGATGTGKTTLLNVLAGFIPDGERIITIEDTAELQLQQDHVVTLESRPPNLEGEGAITQLDLLINALRMRPDRIVVGEARGPEALAMLQAMATGHDGSLTTVHANSPRVALQRIETMVLMSREAPPAEAIRQQIASTMNFVVQQTRHGDGRRRVTAITELAGFTKDGFDLRDVFVFRQSAISVDGAVVGRFVPTGYVPAIVQQLHEFGVLKAVPELFNAAEV